MCLSIAGAPILAAKLRLESAFRCVPGVPCVSLAVPSKAFLFSKSRPMFQDTREAHAQPAMFPYALR